MRLCSAIIALTNSFSDLFFKGWARMPFASQEYKTMTYFEPLKEVVGKRPVWSDATSPLRFTVTRNTSFVRVPIGTVMSTACGGVGVTGGDLVLFLCLLVDLTPCLISF